MHMWNVASRQKILPARPLRCSLLYFHAVMYGIYGVVYLLALGDYMSAYLEHLSYMFMDLFVKVFTAIIISMIHRCDVRVAIKQMSAKTAEANVLMSSLLRASCSCVLRCDISASGKCWINEQQVQEETRWLQNIADIDIL
eukprot:3704093-Amphidinium_carterae.1